MYRFIVNPAAGKGSGKRVWRKLEPMLRQKRIPYEVFMTKYAGHATDIVRYVAFSHDDTVYEEARIVVIGGDGTLHEVVNGLVDPSVSVACIPTGSGNDFARGLSYSFSPSRALNQILNGSNEWLDVARLGDKRCTTVIGMGLDGSVARHVGQAWYRNWLHRLRCGHLSYAAGLYHVVRNFDPFHVRLSLDGEEVAYTNVWLVAVANLPLYGGGMRICPHADAQDGKLEVCIVHGLQRRQIVTLFPRVYWGSHVHHPQVTFRSAQNIQIEASKKLDIHADGQILDYDDRIVRIIAEKQALSVVTNDHFSFQSTVGKYAAK